MQKKDVIQLGPVKLKKTKAYGAISICFWLILWEVVSRCVDNTILMVSPVQVVTTLVDMTKTSEFYRELLSTMSRILGGFLVAVVSGVCLATISYKFEFVAYLLRPIVFVINSTPVASFVILVLIWVGSSNLVIVIAALMVFPVIYSNMYQGFLQVSKEMLEMSQIFRLSLGKKIRYIYLPSLMPYLIVACNLALGMCWKAGIAAEVIGIPMGSIGASLYNAKLYFDTNIVFAWTLVIILLSVFVEKLFVLCIRFVYKKLGGNLRSDRVKKGK